MIWAKIILVDGTFLDKKSVSCFTETELARSRGGRREEIREGGDISS